MSALCRSCRAEIFWAKTPAGKSVPIDKKPIVTGEYFILSRTIERGHTDFQMARAEAGDGKTHFQSHFKSCKTPAQFSRQTRAGAAGGARR